MYTQGRGGIQVDGLPDVSLTHVAPAVKAFVMRDRAYVTVPWLAMATWAFAGYKPQFLACRKTHASGHDIAVAPSDRAGVGKDRPVQLFAKGVDTGGRRATIRGTSWRTPRWPGPCLKMRI